MLHVDSREPPKLRDLLLPAALPTNTLLLDAGDYALFDQDGHSLGIERKATSDLLSSLGHRQANGEKRLFDQLERMTQLYDARILLIEGAWGWNRHTGTVWTGSSRGAAIVRRTTGWRHGALQALLWKAQVAYQAAILFVPDLAATVDLLRVLHTRAEQGCVLPGGSGANATTLTLPDLEPVHA